MPPSRPTLRWIFRTLAEPRFIRLYLADAGLNAPGLEGGRRVESLCELGGVRAAFDRLPADAERREEDRRDALAWLQKVVPSRAWQRPSLFFGAVWRRLAEEAAGEDSDIRDVARYASWDVLFNFERGEDNDANQRARASEPYKLDRYHELHAHLRGSVPFDVVWAGWIHHERWRAALRRESLCCEGWRPTLAELGDVAAAAQQSLSQDGGNTHPARDNGLSRLGDTERNWIQDRLRWLYSQGEAPPPELVVYLSIALFLRTRFLYPRGNHQGAAGLKPFTEVYSSWSRVQKGGPSRDELRSKIPLILERFGEEGAVAVELRPTMERRAPQTLKRLRSVILGYRDHLHSGGTPVALGLVVSLFKQERPAGEEPEQHEEQEKVWARQVSQLCDLLEEHPWLRGFVVGLDAAGQERGCPPRALRRAFAELDSYHRRHNTAALWPGRDVALSRLRVLAGCQDDQGWLDALSREGVGWPRLGRTVHAGEDFVDPLTGLRHIDEAITQLGLRPGDRIGHAIALALTPEVLWKLLERRAAAPSQTGVLKLGERRFEVAVPRGVHLLDLEWASRCDEPPHHLLSLRERSEVATRIWMGEHGGRLLSWGLDSPTSDLPLPGLRFPGGAPADTSAVERVVFDAQAGERFERLRLRVATRVRLSGLTIESCPTSNVIVANLDQAPFRALRAQGLKVALCTDNPGLQGSWPREECLYHAIGTEDRARLLEDGRDGSFVRVLSRRSAS